MSGGNWDYKNLDLVDGFDALKLKKILEIVQLGLHRVDYAISGDTSRERVEKELFDMFEKLGDDLYGG